MHFEYLIHPSSKIAAVLEPGHKITILDPTIRKMIQASGIAVPPNRRTAFGGRWYVYEDDPPDLFAVAFKEFKYPSGLMQQGFKWQKNPKRKTDSELAEDVLQAWKNPRKA